MKNNYMIEKFIISIIKTFNSFQIKEIKATFVPEFTKTAISIKLTNNLNIYILRTGIQNLFFKKFKYYSKKIEENFKEEFERRLKINLSNKTIKAISNLNKKYIVKLSTPFFTLAFITIN